MLVVAGGSKIRAVLAAGVAEAAGRIYNCKISNLMDFAHGGPTCKVSEDSVFWIEGIVRRGSLKNNWLRGKTAN